MGGNRPSKIVQEGKKTLNRVKLPSEERVPPVVSSRSVQPNVGVQQEDESMELSPDILKEIKKWQVSTGPVQVSQ
jgi:hypothetical protein